jgi:exopolysaccharide production protein ExoQ
MPTLALSVCLMFSAWLVVRDCRRRRSVSAAVWIPTALLLILGSRPVSLWVAGGGGGYHEMGNEAASSSLDQIFYLSVIVSSLLVASLRGVKWTKLFTANTAILLLYLFFGASIVWSGDPTGSLKRIAKDFGLLFVIGVIFSEKDPLLAMRAAYVRCAYVLFPLSVVFVKYVPEFSRVYALNGDITITGLTTQKNTLGEMCLIFLLFLLWDYLETRSTGAGPRWRRMPWDRMILVLMGLWLLHLSQSKTALLCTVVGIFLIVRSGWLVSKTIDRVILVGALSLPFLLFSSQQFSAVIAPIVEALGRNMTFTGRANIWQHITLHTVNPLIGSGYWNFWGGPGGNEIVEAMRTVIPNAHDGYLDIYIDGGVVGLTLLFIVLITCGRRIIHRLRASRDTNRYARIRFALLIVAIIYNLSESSFARMGLLWFTTLLMLIEFPAKTVARKVRVAVQLGAAAPALEHATPISTNQ